MFHDICMTPSQFPSRILLMNRVAKQIFTSLFSGTSFRSVPKVGKEDESE